MAVNLDEVLTRGGRTMLDLFEYCVISVQLDPLFVFLVGEYRLHATSEGAVALWDVFCAADAPGRPRTRSAIPPNDLRLKATIKPLYESLIAWEEMRDIDPDNAVPPLLPSKYLFDPLVEAVRASAKGTLAKVAGEFDPTLTPYENLPGGRMTPGHRAFVDGIWRPWIRPRLVGAGFWRVGTIG
jgi:hypothetical protein